MAKLNTFFLMGRDPLGNAEVMLDVCRREYEKAGRVDDADELKRLSVRNADSARKALLLVWNLPEDRNVHRVKHYTVRALRFAVRATESQRRPMLQLAS